MRYPVHKKSDKQQSLQSLHIRSSPQSPITRISSRFANQLSAYLLDLKFG